LSEDCGGIKWMLANTLNKPAQRWASKKTLAVVEPQNRKIEDLLSSLGTMENSKAMPVKTQTSC